MLKGIDPLISPDLLRVLAQMGHGDELVIADANFPAVSVARQTVYGAALRIDCDAVRALRAVLSLIPLDRHEPDPVLTMQVVGDAAAMPEVVAEALPLLTAQDVTPAALERFDFYRRARAAFAVLRSAEPRPYGNFILRKGVIAPDPA
ncbi:L-fucose mutarotase [Paracoccus halophilus]|uniref:L-fucose mutarotase n=1 Tax=Paracoccus halophilus TaxID=376733 RepID=A0A099F393_9RHOB|nr:RbsD/FucU domain-containing protein [Paracoccus halophilus]KGJ04647.1 ribose ABC transporter [Paracoccus halophilus]SFA49882.1 L-fucose mutarotase [Paracoccus halophilus]